MLEISSKKSGIDDAAGEPNLTRLEQARIIPTLKGSAAVSGLSSLSHIVTHDFEDKLLESGGTLGRSDMR